jgi:hypothetical protein
MRFCAVIFGTAALLSAQSNKSKDPATEWPMYTHDLAIRAIRR